jgi:predicted Zn finger-like uncharacterized protein
MVSCPACSAKLKVSDDLPGSGKKIKCPKCQERFAPAPAAAPKPEPAAAPAAPAAAAPTKRKAASEAPALPKRKADSEAPAPSRPAKKPSSEGGLLAEQSWMIRKKERFLFHQFFPLRFDFFRPGTKEEIGYVTERVPFWGKLLRGFRRFQHKIPTRYEVTDTEGGPVLFTVRYPGSFSFKGILFNLLSVTHEVWDADGQLIGSFVFNPFALLKHFTLTDPEGKKMAEFRFKLGDFRPGKPNVPSRMSLLSLEGQEWGSITGEHEAELMQNMKDFQEGKKKMATRVKFLPPPPGMLITVSPEAPDQHLARILLLSAAVAMKRFKVTDEMFQRG